MPLTVPVDSLPHEQQVAFDVIPEECPGDREPQAEAGVEAEEFPTEFCLGSLLNGGLRITAPIHVLCKREEGKVVLEADEINEFGFGVTLPEALRDLQEAIGELYLTLREDEGRLGPDLRNTLQVLQSKIIVRKPQ
jgi:hypothetical protein